MTLFSATGLVDEYGLTSKTCTMPVCTLKNVAVTASSKTFVRAAGSWVTDGFAVGMTPNMT